MKFIAVGWLFFTLLIGSVSAKDNAELVDLAPGWQRVEVDAPPGSLPAPTFRYEPNDHRNASLLITILGSGDGRISDRATLDQFQLFLCRQYLASPNDHPHQVDFEFPSGIGVYASFEDPSLVGKPAHTGDYKVATPVALLLHGKLVLHATIFTDETSGKTFDEALGMLKTLDIPVPAVSGLSARKEGAKTIVSMPHLDAALVIPAEVAESPLKLNRSNSYFSFTTKDGIMLSGWIEPAKRFKGLRPMWAEEKARMETGTGLKCENEKFEILNGWQVVEYTVAIGKSAVQQNIRASQTKGQTWIDLHLSITANQAQITPLKNLLGSLEISGRSGH